MVGDAVINCIASSVLFIGKLSLKSLGATTFFWGVLPAPFLREDELLETNAMVAGCPAPFLGWKLIL